MRNLKPGLQTIRELKKKLRRGDATAVNNIAATYREIGNRKRAFHWWRRAASLQDGDAWLEVGYCLQYGIGTRRNVRGAIKAYRKALVAYYISEYCREETEYHLAIALLDFSIKRSKNEIRQLLQQASEEGDFPQATTLLAQLDLGQPLRVCRCRRGLLRRLVGKAHCALHH